MIQNKGARYKMETEMPSFNPAFVILWIFAVPSQELVLFSKAVSKYQLKTLQGLSSHKTVWLEL
jgi:hypothetical protein